MENLFRENWDIISETCYACRNDLVGKSKYNNYYDNDYYNRYPEEWECYCTEDEEIHFNDFFCPMCDHYFKESEYLRTAIHDEKVLWIANMITHYRHQHLRWWDKKYGRNANRHRSYGDYDDDKIKVNNSSKRQIIRKCGNYLNFHGVGREHFLQLHENDEKTLQLIEKIIKPPLWI